MGTGAIERGRTNQRKLTDSSCIGNQIVIYWGMSSGRYIIRACLLLSAALPLFGGVKMHVIQGRPVVDGVYVNGHGPYRFLLDTATTFDHIEPELAQAIGLKATFRSELTSSIGLRVVTGSEGAEVTLGSARAGEQRFLFAGMDVVHQLSPEIRGILGQEFLSRFDYLLDVRGRSLEFGLPERLANRTRVPFRTLHGRPVVATSLGELAVDSGVDWVTLFGVEGNEGPNVMLTMTGSALVGRVAGTLAIDGHTFWRGAAVAIPSVAEADVAGLLPISVFRTVYISNSTGYVVFE